MSKKKPPTKFDTELKPLVDTRGVLIFENGVTVPVYALSIESGRIIVYTEGVWNGTPARRGELLYQEALEYALNRSLEAKR